MKIVHIGANTTGGAGLGMMGVHKALLASGVDSKVVTLRVNPGEESSPDIEVIESVPFEDPVGAIVQDLRKKHRLPVSSPYSGIRLEELPCVKEADIIHLHWVSGMVNIETFFPKIDKPVVWTIRDENPMLGLYHFDRERPVNPTEEECRADLLLKSMKEKAISACKDLTYVSLAKGMKARLDASAIGGRESFVIPNRIDADKFKPMGRGKVRQEFSIAESETVILFAVQFLGEKRKGLQELLDALGQLATDEKPFTVLCVGHGKIEAVAPANVRIVLAGPTTDQCRMAEFYSAADLFVSPSYSETFGKTTAESLACGTPVVSFPNLGALDIVEDGVDGFLSEAFNPCALARSIDKALRHHFDPEKLVSRVKQRYSQEVVANAHLALYRHIVETPVKKRRIARDPKRVMPTPAKNRRPKLSIITICYNNMEGLRETLWSTLHEQYGFTDFEQIVVDGGSKDNTMSVIEEYKDRLAWWCSEPDGGIYNAMNKGASHARGEYLLFLNSGDVLCTDMLAEVFRERFDEELVYGDIYGFANGRKMYMASVTESERKDSWFLYNSLPHQGTLIKRALHDRLGGYDESYHISAAPKFMFDAFVVNRCSIRRLPFAFSVFDRTGLSSQPQYLGEKLKEWERFLSPYFGVRVVNHAMRWLIARTVIDKDLVEMISNHQEWADDLKRRMKNFIMEREAGKPIPTYTIRFHRNNGTDTYSDKIFEFGVREHIPSILHGLNWTSTAYEFLGWATSVEKARKHEIWKKDWSYVTKGIAVGKTLNVYAVWKKRAGGGRNVPDAAQKTKGD